MAAYRSLRRVPARRSPRRRLRHRRRWRGESQKAVVEVAEVGAPQASFNPTPTPSPTHPWASSLATRPFQTARWATRGGAAHRASEAPRTRPPAPAPAPASTPVSMPTPMPLLPRRLSLRWSALRAPPAAAAPMPMARFCPFPTSLRRSRDGTTWTCGRRRRSCRPGAARGSGFGQMRIRTRRARRRLKASVA